MSDQERSFIEQVRHDPHDEMARLIYADFLEDAGDPRGELIRVQVELAAAEVGNSRRLPLVERERSLLAEYGESWLEPLRALGAEGVSVRCFQRGLIERVKISADRFLQSGSELCRIAPALYCLELSHFAGAAERLAKADLPPQITALDLAAKRLQASDLQVIQRANWLPQIVELQLNSNRLGDDGVRALCGCELPRLMRLSLDINRLGPDSAGRLANWPTLAHVKQLSLSVNRLGDIGIQRFCQSVFTTTLERLDMASNGIGTAGLRHLSQATGLASLKELNLRSNRILAEGLPQIVDSPLFEQLTGIDLRGNEDAAIDMLVKALPAGVVRALS